MYLYTKNMYSGYFDITVLWDINISISKGEVVTILGPNGAGKTTLLYTLIGIIRPSKGNIIFNGKDLSKEPIRKRVEAGLSLVPEGRHIFPKMTVYENLEVAGLATKRGRKYFKDSLELVHNLFPWLKERRNQKAGTLSGGEQQMLAIARALMNKPLVLMLDEPSQGLAPKIIDEIYTTLQKLNVEEKVTLIIAEQQLTKAINIANKAYVLEKGKLAYEGEPQKAIADLRKIYVG